MRAVGRDLGLNFEYEVVGSPPSIGLAVYSGLCAFTGISIVCTTHAQLSPWLSLLSQTYFTM